MVQNLADKINERESAAVKVKVDIDYSGNCMMELRRIS